MNNLNKVINKTKFNNNYNNNFNNNYTSYCNNKGQVEIVGLLVIVLLISLMLLFAVRVVFFKEQTNELADFKDNQLVSSFTATLLRTTAEGCSNKQDIEEVITLTARNPSYICRDSGINGIDYLDQIISLYLRSILGNEKIPYQYLIYTSEFGGQSIIINITSENLSKTSATTDIFPIPGGIFAQLCVHGECYLQ